MQPIGNAWQKLPRIVRDLTADLDKEIELEMHGADTELDRQVLERIKDPLTHMVRNSADHGLESRAERIAAGKPEKGIDPALRLSRRRAHHHRDRRRRPRPRHPAHQGQGAGQRARDRGRARKDVGAQIQKFIFAPGFSTAQDVTSVSGRGVGMDVVRTNIDQIGGTIDVQSVPGKGLSFTIKIPLTLAIISALIVESGGERFAIPQLSVVELVRVHAKSEHRIERIKDAAVLRLRNKLLPLVRLSSLLELDADKAIPEKGFIVVTHVGAQTFGMVVDGVFHTEEIVVKPMSTKLRHIGMFSGNTILGDGSVIMIIDPNGVSQQVGTSIASAAMAQANSEAEHRVAAENTMSLLVFRAGSPQPKAVPLSLVTRLEEIDCRKIELSNGRHMVQYRGQLMPLVHASDEVRVKREGAQPLLVFSDGHRSMGLVVDEIVDIVEDRLDIQVGSNRPGVLGSAVVRGQATEILDIGHFLPLAYRRLVPQQGRARGRQGPHAAPGRRLRHSSATCSRRCSRPRATRSRRFPAPRKRWRCSRRATASTRWSPTSTCRRWTGSRWPRRCAASSSSAKCRSSRCRRTARRKASSADARSASTTTLPSSIVRVLIAALKEQTADIIQAA